MISLIEEIITKFGPRPAGTDAEKNSQLFLQSKCAELTDKVQFLPFDEYLDARFGKLKYFVAFFFLSLALYWFLPVAAFVLSFLNGIVLMLDIMMYRDVLTSFPGSKQTSSNVEAVLEPKGEVKSTLLLSAHIDSTYEYTWWNRLGHTGVLLSVVAGVLIVLSSVFHLFHWLHPTSYDNYVWLFFLVLSPITVVFWDMIGDEAVPGAQDNLSGISIAFEVFKTFADKDQKGRSVLNNTRLKFVSFGSEEKGLCGSRAYAKLKKEELKKENAHLLNVDNIRLANQITIIARELMSGTTHAPVMVNGMKKSFEDQNIPYKMGMAPIGGSDAISLARVGIPSVTIIGMDSSKHDFTYHTRHDIVEHIEPLALENVKKGLLYFIRSWDAK